MPDDQVSLAFLAALSRAAEEAHPGRRLDHSCAREFVRLAALLERAVLGLPQAPILGEPLLRFDDEAAQQ